MADFKSISLLLLSFFCLLGGVLAETYQLGLGKTYTTMKSVPLLREGDVLEVYPGTYNEYKYFTSRGTVENPIIIRGMGKIKPVFDGKGLNVTGAGRIPRALFQFAGSNYLVENIEFINADNDDGNNGAGIRIQAEKISLSVTARSQNARTG